MVRLHRLERKLLLFLKDEKTWPLDTLAKTAGLNDAAVMRASLWLAGKNMAKIIETRKTFVQLGSEGQLFLRDGLPERRLVDTVLRAGGKAGFDEALKSAGLSGEQGSIALGWAKRKEWLRTRERKRETDS